MTASGSSRGYTDAPAAPLGVLPHHAYKEIVERSVYRLFQLDPRARVVDKRAFDEMQSYLVELNAGAEAEHTYEDPSGRVFDCIPVEQQPSLRGKGAAPAQPPDLTDVLSGKPPRTDIRPAAPVVDTRRDRHGNRMQAPTGTIPIRRVTLDEMVRFTNLTEFFRKYPVNRSAEQPGAPAADSGQNHRYAYTHQTVDNIGAHSALAVYAPPIDANQIFSLAQHWYAGGTGAAHQTVEVGWQVYPQKYGHQFPVLFIYYTPDNYATGAYNLDGPGFVQTNSAWAIGGSLAPVSTPGGQQMEIDVCVYLYNGNWWIYVGGVTAANAIGYYPTSLYSAGQMASHATEILFGGETVTSAVSWPPMGSGAFAADGWQHAAYQRSIYYFPPEGGAQWTSLTKEEPSLACYSLNLSTAPAPWGIYFFFGGTGGGNC